MSDLILESIRAIVLGLLLVFFVVNSRGRYSGYPGIRIIFAGFGLIFLATLLDITDEIRGLERFVLIGDTLAEAILEKLFGYLLGFMFILAGLVRLLPSLAASKESASQLSESESRFLTIFNTIPDVVAITRLCDGTVVDINQAYQALTGFTREDIIGRSSIEMGAWVNPSDREKMIAGIKTDGFIRDLEAPMLTTDGKIRDSLVSARMMTLNGEPHLLTIFKDITERKNVERALKDSENRFRLIYESNPDPVVLSRLSDGVTLDVNSAFVEVTGISRLEALGHNSEELGLWHDTGQRHMFLEKVGEKGSIDNLEAVFSIRDGGKKVGLLSARVISINEEPVILIVIRDISKEKEVERAMIEMDRMKNEFISTAAHELRTPLSTMMGYTELVRDPDEFGGFSREQIREFHDVIYEKGEALTRIVDDLLDISRIESGHQVILDRQDVDIKDMLEKFVRRFKINSRKHDYKLDLTRLHEDSVLKIDRQRITQVLENLMSNAVKYSPRDSLITIVAESVDTGCRFTVEDQGNGMTPEQLARIFDKFYRADATNTAVSGLGLGMSIARQLVEVHNGRIWVDSTLGKGTRASFILPAQ